MDTAPSAPVSLETNQVAGQVTTMVENDVMYYQLTDTDDDLQDMKHVFHLGTRHEHVYDFRSVQ